MTWTGGEKYVASCTGAIACAVIHSTAVRFTQPAWIAGEQAWLTAKATCSDQAEVTVDERAIVEDR